MVSFRCETRKGEAMEKYLNMPIKEVITEFPKVADTLNEYNIGCVPCSVGSCLLKDVVEIHNLSVENEQGLMAKIARIIYPGQAVTIPKLKRKLQPGFGELKYSPPIKKLVDEHTLIKRLIALIPEVIETVKTSPKIDKDLILGVTDFIRSYADKFHHAKEEEILFKYFDSNLDIVKTMLQDHDTGRNHVKGVIKALEESDREMIVKHLDGYRELLTEHIKKEDEILYPWMDRNLSTAQIGELFGKFSEVDTAYGKEVPERCERFVKDLEQKNIKSQKKEAVK